MAQNQRDLAFTDKVECPPNGVGKQLKRSPSFSDWDSAGFESKSLAGQPEVKTEPYTDELPCPESQARVSKAFPKTELTQKMLLPSPHPETGTTDVKVLPAPSGPSTTQLYSGMKRKASANDLKALPAPSPPASVIQKSSVDDFFCELCQVNCSSPLTHSYHLKGKKHKAKLWNRENWNSYDGPKGSTPGCHVCQISCSDQFALEMHKKGKKHMAKLQQIINEGPGARKPVRCELCLVSCMNEDAFQQHLEGRKHAYQVMLARRGPN